MEGIIQILHLKIVHRFLHERQKSMMFLLIKQIIFTLQCLPTYNLTECSDNYSDTLERLCQFKRDKVPADDTE